MKVERGGDLNIGSSLSVVKTIPDRAPWPRMREISDEDIYKWTLPENMQHVERGAIKLRQARSFELPGLFGELWARVLRANGDVQNFGLLSLRVVTTAGVGFIVDAFQNLVELEILKYHGIGTGTNAEASSDTALQTELTTQYNPDSTRATGTLAENAANIFETVATNSVDSAVAITEHGIFSQAATGGGTLLDRSVFSAVNLASGDSIETTYRLTLTAGG